MPASWDAVISLLGPDLPAREWARRAGCSTTDVRATADAQGVRLGAESDEDALARAMRTIREVEGE